MPHSFRRETLALGVQHVAVIVLGCLLFLLDQSEGLPDRANYLIVLTFVLVKSVYFVFHNFRSIGRVIAAERTFNHFILLVSVNVALIVVSFATDYFIVYRIYPDSFRGVLASDGTGAAFEMLYFSLVTFTTTGFGDIVPASNLSRLPVSLEVVVGFVTTIFVISNFSNFKAR